MKQTLTTKLYSCSRADHQSCVRPSLSSNEHRIIGQFTVNGGKPVHGLNTTSSSKASKRWQEKQWERIADG
jgi:hypothetical protein